MNSKDLKGAEIVPQGVEAVDWEWQWEIKGKSLKSIPLSKKIISGAFKITYLLPTYYLLNRIRVPSI